MKILAFVDMHGSNKALKRVKKLAKKADVLVAAGDLTVFGNNLDLILMELNKLGKPVLVIPGNHEFEDDIKKASSMFTNIISIDKKPFVIYDTVFIGYGGGGFSMSDKGFERYSKKLLKKIKKHSKSVLVLHGPPYGNKTDLIMEEHCGNRSYSNFIKKAQPTLVICGHLHECAGKMDTIKKTLVVNPGPYGKILEI